jgi:hypothetical protein
LKLTRFPARSSLPLRGFAFCLADPIGSAADFEQDLNTAATENAEARHGEQAVDVTAEICGRHGRRYSRKLRHSLFDFDQG